jgi:hypothetical protein
MLIFSYGCLYKLVRVTTLVVTACETTHLAPANIHQRC